MCEDKQSGYRPGKGDQLVLIGSRRMVVSCVPVDLEGCLRLQWAGFLRRLLPWSRAVDDYASGIEQDVPMEDAAVHITNYLVQRAELQPGEIPIEA